MGKKGGRKGKEKNKFGENKGNKSRIVESKGRRKKKGKKEVVGKARVRKKEKKKGKEKRQKRR